MQNMHSNGFRNLEWFSGNFEKVWFEMYFWEHEIKDLFPENL